MDPNRLINQRCRDVGCTARLMARPDGARGIVQHGPNPEHVIVLTLDDPDWALDVEAWIGRIHAA